MTILTLEAIEATDLIPASETTNVVLLSEMGVKATFTIDDPFKAAVDVYAWNFHQ